MHLAPDRLYFGVAPTLLVDCAVQLRDRESGFSRDDFCKALGAPWREAKAVMQEMLQQGYFVPGGLGDAFLPTMKLRQLASASISHGLARSEAERLLRRVVEMAASVNAQPAKYPRSVSCLAVFGSYLGDKPLLGDLDIAVELGPERREPDIGKRVHIEELLRRNRSESNRTMAALRLRKPKFISLHLMDEVLELGTPFEVVFGRPPDKASAKPKPA